MTALTDYRARLRSEPLTINQLGRIHCEFMRLGFDTDDDRAERLRLTAILARSGPVGSTKELTLGQAGRAVCALSVCRTVSELYAVTEPPPCPLCDGTGRVLGITCRLCKGSGTRDLGPVAEWPKPLRSRDPPFPSILWRPFSSSSSAAGQPPFVYIVCTRTGAARSCQ